MNYHVILFIKPESIDYSGPLKWRISKGKFERVCDSEVNMIQFGEDVYRLDDKKIFSIQDNDGQDIHGFVVCEAHKLKQSV